MNNSAKISEKYDVKTDILRPTSAAGATSINFDMQNFDRALLTVHLDGTCTGPVTVDLMESSAATVGGTSAAGGKAGVSIGGVSTLISSTGGVRAIKMTPGTATTSETFRMQISTGTQRAFTYTTSTANLNSTAWASTQFYYGSTVGSTVDTGLQLTVDSLKTALASTIGFGNIFSFSTPTSATLGIKLLDNATGNIVFSNTNSSVVPLVEWNEAVVGFDLRAEDLTSTANKRYLGIKVTSVTTGVGRAAVNVLRYGGYGPAAFGGMLST